MKVNFVRKNIKEQMKKLILAAIVCGMTFTTVAQDANFRLGGTLGLNLTNELSKGGGVKINSKIKPGLRIGVLGEYNFNKWIGVSAELLFSQKGGKMKESFGGETYQFITRLNYLQIPIHAVGSYQINDDFKVTALLGPALGFALTGSYISKGGGSSTEKEKIKFGNSLNDDLRAFDFGLNFGVGAEWKNIFFRLQYEIGLSNLVKSEGGGYSVRNSCFSISAGYFFWKK